MVEACQTPPLAKPSHASRKLPMSSHVTQGGRVTWTSDVPKGANSMLLAPNSDGLHLVASLLLVDSNHGRTLTRNIHSELTSQEFEAFSSSVWSQPLNDCKPLGFPHGGPRNVQYHQPRKSKCLKLAPYQEGFDSFGHPSKLSASLRAVLSPGTDLCQGSFPQAPRQVESLL